MEQKQEESKEQVLLFFLARLLDGTTRSGLLTIASKGSVMPELFGVDSIPSGNA